MGQGLGVERGFYRPGLAHNNPAHAHTHTTSGPTAGSVPQRTGAAGASAPELREVTVVRSLDRSALFLRVLRDNTLARLLPVAGTIWRRCLLTWRLAWRLPLTTNARPDGGVRTSRIAAPRATSQAVRYARTNKICRRSPVPAHSSRGGLAWSRANITLPAIALRGAGNHDKERIAPCARPRRHVNGDPPHGPCAGAANGCLRGSSGGGPGPAGWDRDGGPAPCARCCRCRRGEGAGRDRKPAEGFTRVENARGTIKLYPSF
jgi:hypothetical protein